MSARWALSPRDHRSHALAEDTPAPEGLLIGRCGHRMPASVDVDDHPAIGGAMCSLCAEQVVKDAIGPPVFYAPGAVATKRHDRTQGR